MRKLFFCAFIGLLAILVFAASAARQEGALKREIRTAAARPSKAPLSQAIAAGGFVFCSGQLPVDPQTGKIVEGGIEEQTRQVLKNLSAVLEAAGCSFDHVVKCTVMISDMNDFSGMNKVYAEFFKTPAPARATFAASGLALNAKVEIECIAVLGPGGGK